MQLEKSRRPKMQFVILNLQFQFPHSIPGERPPHKETQAYGCCVSTLTRFARPPLQRPLTGDRADAALAPHSICTLGLAGRQRRRKVESRGSRVESQYGRLFNIPLNTIFDIRTLRAIYWRNRHANEFAVSGVSRAKVCELLIFANLV